MKAEEQELPEGIVDSITWDELTDGKWPLSWWHVRNSMDAYFSKRLLFDHVDPIHLNTVPALLQYGRYKAWKLDQATAKVKELRERLREMEWRDDGTHVTCDACRAAHNKRRPYDPVHWPRCWLKAEIDQLEAEEG